MFKLLFIIALSLEYRNCAYFGVDDIFDCNCVNNEQCEKDTGSCINGCSESWSGPSCQKQCNVGTYGSECSKFCYCLNNVGCSDNGVCPNGCRHGWQGPHCDIESAPNNFLIFTDSEKKAIIRLDLSSKGYITLPITSHENPIALDFDEKESRIYWTDVLSKQIRSASLSGGSETLIRQLNNVSIPDGIAVDSVNRFIFYTDTGNDVIAKMKMDGSFHQEIIKTGLDEPRAIVLDTNNRKIYWTDWGQNPKIMSADYDGNNQKSLITTGLRWPNSLALDFKNNRMFWTDAGTKRIETATVGGSSRKTLSFSSTSHYFGIAYHENVIYVTDWNQKSVMKLNLGGIARLEPFGPAAFGRINDVHVYVFQGDQSDCVNNTYGPGCFKKCNDRNCKGSQDCNAITGECKDGCKPGYRGLDCITECRRGFYGPGCESDCLNRHCTQQDKCDSLDGACTCLDGYEGKDCTVKKIENTSPPKQECKRGFYGPECESDCLNRHCTQQDKCDSLDGACTCLDGYEGKDCTVKKIENTGPPKQECKRGFYGPECESDCLNRHCTQQDKCDSLDGACTCLDGYEGVDCTVKKFENTGPSKQAEINPTWIVVGTILGLVIGICIGVCGMMLFTKLRSSKNRGKIVYNASTNHCNMYNNNVPINESSTDHIDNRDSGNYDSLSPHIDEQPYQKF